MSDVMTVRKSWNRKDITVQTFGYLTAIGYDHFDGKSSIGNLDVNVETLLYVL